MKLSRRGFMQSGMAAAALPFMAGAQAQPAAGAAATTPATQKPMVCIFSKHLQFLNYTEMAAALKEMGADGTDLTVRPKGHVLPENVERDLPAAVAAVRAVGLEVPMISVRVNDAKEPDAERIAKVAAQEGIPYVRLSDYRYELALPIPPQVEAFTAQLRGMGEVLDRHGLTGGYHNHSGTAQFGGPIWDLHQALTTIHAANLGSNFDVGHAMVEGTLGAAEVNTHLIAPHVKMSAVKDFVWEGAKPKWVPLGEGIVPIAKMYGILRKAGFSGPISIHFEYEPASNDALLKDMAAAVKVLRGALSEAGY